MSIAIESIRIKKAGPLTQFQAELGRLNLFYGLNESGKTYLVEFVLRSLFHPSKHWNLRDTILEGSVTMEGLEGKANVFSPGSTRKLEDYWKDLEAGLPVNLSRLLVVKGGELALTPNTRGGVSRDVLKTALTSQALLDDLWELIQPTIRNAVFENGQILGKNMGKLKEHNLLREEIERSAKLLAQIDRSYSQGPARQIEMQLEKIQTILDRQLSAKRHLAYQLWKNIQDLKSQQRALPEDAISRQRDRIRDYLKAEEEIQSLEDQLKDLSKKSNGYSWLTAAIETWEEKGLGGNTKPPKEVGLASVLSLVIGIILLILEFYFRPGEMFWLGMAFASLGLGSLLYYLYKLQNWASQIDNSKERHTIIRKFEEKFGSAPDSLVDLREQRNKLQEIYLRGQATKSLIDEKTNHLKLESQRIETIFEQLTGNVINSQDWHSEIDHLQALHQKYAAEIQDLQLHLSRLNVPQDDFREKPVSVPYDPDLIPSLEKNRDNLESDLHLLQDELETLKARACERTGDDINTAWPEVYYHLRNKHDGLTSEYQQLTAEIIAEIGLSEILVQLRKEEDQKIVKALNGPMVSGLISNLTGNYKRLNLIDNQLYVYDDYTHYALQDLSTGAREQVLLALRLGIASQVCGGDSLFLVLDDAFQHSDWQRRNALVKSTIELVNNGWQVLYFSMDEHIRDLYIKEAKPALKNDFQQINLP